MRTASEMYNYCKKNNLGQGFTESQGLKHFGLIESSLLPDEDVLVPFIGLHNYINAGKHDNNYAYALTNKRLLLAQKKLFGQNIQSINKNNINDITYSTKGLFSIVTVDTIKEAFNVCVGGHSCGQMIFNMLQDKLNNKE